MMQRVIGAALLLFALEAAADVFRPAYLEITELGNDEYSVLWKVPASGSDRRLAAYVRLPEGAKTVEGPLIVARDNNWVERTRIHYPGTLAGQAFEIEGKAVGVTEVIARVERLDGSSQVERLAMERPQFIVEAPQGTGAVAWSYLVLGVEHILGGIDHLLFVLALLLIVHGGRRIVATVTAFTVAHSFTLVAATLGWVHVPGPPVEAIIALSIVFVASEIVHIRQGRPSMTERVPWVVAFSFGLLHGFGFAGALAEVGLPQTAIPLALLTFNVGVELGQLMFVAGFVLLRVAAARIVTGEVAWVPTATAYAIGATAAFWTIERVASFWA